MAEKVNTEGIKALLWKAGQMQMQRETGKEGMFVLNIFTKLEEKFGKIIFRNIITGALTDNRDSLQAIKKEVRAYLKQYFPDKNVTPAQITRLAKNFAQYTWCLWCEEMFPGELADSIKAEKQALRNMKTIFNNINLGETRKTRGAGTARGAKTAGQKKTMKRAGSARTGETLNKGRSECFRRGKVKEPGRGKIPEVKLRKLW